MPDIGARENPVVEELGKEKPTPRPLQQDQESGKSRGYPDQREAARLRRECARKPCDRDEPGEEPIRIQEEQGVTPIGAQITPQRAARDEIDESEQAERNAPPERLIASGGNKVVPAHKSIAGFDAPVRARRDDVPRGRMGLITGGEAVAFADQVRSRIGAARARSADAPRPPAW